MAENTANPPQSAPVAAEAPAVAEKPKKKYSKKLKSAQKAGRAATKASARIASAVAAGLENFLERQEASARKKRDGALRDGLENWTRAMAKTMDKAADVPSEMMKAMDTKRARKAARAVLGVMMPRVLR